MNVLTFLATNYVAHAATVKSSPGEGAIAVAMNTVLALCFPMFGLLRAINAIARRSRFGGSELKNACRAGALCMVVRSPEWRPEVGEEVEAIVVEEIKPEEENMHELEDRTTGTSEAEIINYLPSYAREGSSAWAYFDSIGARAHVDLDNTRIHGSYKLSPGYTFAIVPRHASLLEFKDTDAMVPDEASNEATFTTQFSAGGIVEDHESNSENTSNTSTAFRQCISRIAGRAAAAMRKEHTATTASRGTVSDISSNYSLVKPVASMVQILSAFNTLFLHRSDVVERWGYASFHLTVIPYLVMSMVNLVSNLLSADYSCIYMVESETMREAKKRGSVFAGAVAVIEEIERGNAPRPTLEDAPSWTGFTSQHMYAVARLLVFDYAAIIKLMRKPKYPLSNIRVLRRLPNEPQDDKATERSAQKVSRACSHNLAQDMTPVVELESAGALTHHVIDIPPEPSDILTGVVRSELDRMRRPLTVHQGNRQDERTSTSEPGGEARLAITLSTNVGHQYKVMPYRPPLRPRISKLLIGPDGGVANSVETTCATLGSLRNIQVTSEEAFLMVHSFGWYDPVRLRLIQGIRSRQDRRLEKMIWKTGWRILLKVVSQEVLPEIFGYHKRVNVADAPNPSRIYIPSCTRLVHEGTDRTGQSMRRGRPKLSLLLEGFLGCLILGVMFTFIGSESWWFFCGQSSLIERAIIVMWSSEGAFGLLLPLISLKETTFIFCQLPVYTILVGIYSAPWFLRLTALQGTPLLYVLMAVGCLPLGIFIAPIWGFVLVGRMLVEWGTCVRLY